MGARSTMSKLTLGSKVVSGGSRQTKDELVKATFWPWLSGKILIKNQIVFFSLGSRVRDPVHAKGPGRWSHVIEKDFNPREEPFF